MISIPVAERSGVAEARRGVEALARRLGFEEAAVGRAAIVATELATNLVRHGSPGEMLVGAYEDATGSGIEVLALDCGPGMANIAQCLEDGYSTADTPGTGLGAVLRQSTLVDIASWPGGGTAVLARLTGARRPPSAGAGGIGPGRGALPRCGAVCVPKPGEEACGDGWAAVEAPDGVLLMVVDGLGHGPLAAEVAVEAVRLFRGMLPGTQPGEVLAALHAGLRGTRGAAVSVARLPPGRGELVFAGLGNVGCTILDGAGTRRAVSHNGTAGLTAPRIQEFRYPLAPSALVMLHSDGLSASWAMERYPGLAAAHPTLVAGVLYRDFARRRDDATILVARAAGMAGALA